MSFAPYRYLTNLGLTNNNCENLASIAGHISKDLRATFCCGDCLSGYQDKKLVHVGNEYLKSCPKCKSRVLYYDTVTPRRAAAFRRAAL